MSHPRRIIWFCDTDAVARNPHWLKQLRDEIGLTTIMPESSVCHTSGFAATPGIAARGPFEDWRCREDRWPRAAEGIYPPVAGIVGGFDDGSLCRLIDAARAVDIEVWGHLGLWSYGGDVYPEWAMQDLDGLPLDRRYQSWGIGLCPSRRALNEWVGDGLLDLVARYSIDGFCVDHARYPSPANVHALYACGCADCRSGAGVLGFDFEALAAAVRAARRRLAALDEAVAARALRTGWTGVALLDALGLDGAALVSWLRCRAALVSEPMAAFRARVRAARPELVFGSDVFAASIALPGGHDLVPWQAATDFITGGSSAGGVVGWATGMADAVASWSTELSAAARIDPELARQLCQRFFAADTPVLPATSTDVRELPVALLYQREVERLAALSTGAIPLYPPISADGDPELVRDLCAAVGVSGCHGAMVSVDPERPAAVRALAEGLAAVGETEGRAS